MGRWRADENDSNGARDHLGSVPALATPGGDIVESYEYEPYGLPTVYDDEGEIIASRTSTVGNRFMFTGREWEPEGQFYHYRHRTYSPHEKRFMQRDPIGLAGGWNVYAYCGGDPVNASDPMGLREHTVHLDDGTTFIYEIHDAQDRSLDDLLDNAFRSFSDLRTEYTRISDCFGERIQIYHKAGDDAAATFEPPSSTPTGVGSKSAIITIFRPASATPTINFPENLPSDLVVDYALHAALVWRASVLLHELHHADQYFCDEVTKGNLTYTSSNQGESAAYTRQRKFIESNPFIHEKTGYSLTSLLDYVAKLRDRKK